MSRHQPIYPPTPHPSRRPLSRQPTVTIEPILAIFCRQLFPGRRRPVHHETLRAQQPGEQPHDRKRNHRPRRNYIRKKKKVGVFGCRFGSFSLKWFLICRQNPASIHQPTNPAIEPPSHLPTNPALSPKVSADVPDARALFEVYYPGQF